MEYGLSEWHFEVWDAEILTHSITSPCNILTHAEEISKQIRSYNDLKFRQKQEKR